MHPERVEKLVLVNPIGLEDWKAVVPYRSIDPAIASAQAKAPGKTLSDVRADLRFENILIWRQECLEVTAAAR